MQLPMVIFLLPFVAIFSLCHAKINANDPLAVAITPKIWNLLTTKANFISNVVTSIRFPDFGGKKSMVKYRVWNGRVDHFSVPQSGVSFLDMNNGIHLSITNIQFHATTRGRVELGKKVFRKWVRIARMSGDIKAKSANAGIDIVLVWNDFKFTPTVTMNSNVRIDFTHNLRRYLNFLRSRVQKMVTSKVNSEVPKLLNKAIQEKVNPRLQKLKQKIIEMGITQYGIEWKVQNNILRVILRPRGRGRKHQQPAPPPSRPIPANPLKGGIDFTCVAPQFRCEGLACTYCTDVDINPSSTGPTDKFHNCLPGF
ncbi:hypothetical protein ANCCAN_21615 [Ancylostoma caninum]|uniref:Lipid-binding serum glycoprotein N-terminal domain-containing protein n=1 Tax=Ancylostoma caninum TaxID=29170 RepID=A0A368FP46_ANCCA|nr:hypothetical protein ANCCAN_21615 [Ancylostoma caninum]